MTKTLMTKIKSKKFTLGVIGLGYVGLPLACEFAKEGVAVIGFDIDSKKVKQINQGKSYILDVPQDEFKQIVKEHNLKATTDFKELNNVDVISICVPTPLRKTKDPDMSYIVSAVNAIKDNMRKGQIIILESTTYPGTTEELILSEIETNGFKVGKDFFLAFSPERVDPGNSVYATKNTPKVLGGVTKDCIKLSKEVYKIAINEIVTVSSPKAAEMVKLYENTFRSVNIGMANELAIMCDKLDINVWEVIEAAATKPFGFMPFYPGPGLGGHCIPIDPFYLSWKLKTVNYDAKFISLASEINSNMPTYVLQKIMEALNSQKKSVNKSKIAILGVAYKKDINDLRESPALDIMALLKGYGAQLSYHDDFVPTVKLGETSLTSKPLTDKYLSKQDCIVVITNHTYFKMKEIVSASPLIVDTRNATKGISSSKIHRI